MPELPDVEAFRRDFAARGLGTGIENVRLEEPGYLRGASLAQLRAALEKDRFAQVTRHGKILFAETERGPVLVMHFGMTGAIQFLEPGEAQPQGTCLWLGFADGRGLAVLTQRKLGWLELTDDQEGYLRENGVAPDALTLSQQAFAERIGAGRGRLKSALMNQSKIAGIGNVYSDEILFRAGLSPRSKRQDLSQEQLQALYQAMRSVLEEASEILSSGAELPGDWLAQHREEGAPCPRCGTPLRREKIGGRSAYFCPRCQKAATG